MAKSLIIVESPAKIKTLKGFLGKEYEVAASMGHVRDLPKSKLGINTESHFEMEYEPLKDRKEVLSKLVAAAKGMDMVYLATDPDREGEAISWHIKEALKLKSGKFCRIQFNEITKTAVQAALANPRSIDIEKVNAQEARRALDRFIGYKISPLLWRKVKPSLSAGRVQSVAVRIVCDREREIQVFVPVEYWSLTANLSPQEAKTAKKQAFDAALHSFDGKKLDLTNEDQTNGVVADLKGAQWVVSKVKKSERQRRPSAPFITSTLQQEASRKLGFGAQRTMRTAQQLYEGIDLGSNGGTVGLITYMRTDSTRVAGEAQESAKRYITTTYGPTYAPAKYNTYASKNTAQDAHEAIRPTDVYRDPVSIKSHLSADQYRLYELVWLRFVASQMTPAVMDVVQAQILANNYDFRASGSTIKFDGFLKIYSEGKDDVQPSDDDDKKTLPPLTEGQVLDLNKLLPKQHFTEPPPRYSEATLVKAMEEQGIGRPSTYASILSTITKEEHQYVELKEKRFHPTELGFLVNDMLVKHFPRVLDVKFTAGMETELDDVEEGKRNKEGVLKDFWTPFADTVKAAETEMERYARDTGEACPECGSALVEKMSRYGKMFTGCSNHPACKYIKPSENKGENGEVVEPIVSDILCPNCNRNLVQKMGRFGPFLACPGYPDCKYIHKTPVESTGIKCPTCGEGELVQKKSRMGVFYSCNRYPKCKTALPSLPLERKCPQCEGVLVETTYKGRVTGVKCLTPDCDYKETAKEIDKETTKEAAEAAA